MGGTTLEAAAPVEKARAQVAAALTAGTRHIDAAATPTNGTIDEHEASNAAQKTKEAQ